MSQAEALRLAAICLGEYPSREAWAKDYYDRKRREGKSHSMAVRALANVWVRIIFAMWHKREAYQRSTFETAKLRHARQVA